MVYLVFHFYSGLGPLYPYMHLPTHHAAEKEESGHGTVHCGCAE